MSKTALATATMAMVLAALTGCEQEFTPSDMETAAAERSRAVGKPAPGFSLPDQNNKPVALSDLRGKWVVLYFYPKDDTPGCACQATEFTKLLTDFRGMDAVIYGVSEDSPASHRRFIGKYDLGIDLLSDPDHRMMTAYGAWVRAGLGEDRQGRVIRSTYIIGPDGIIRAHYPEVIPAGHAERVRRRLVELRQGG